MSLQRLLGAVLTAGGAAAAVGGCYARQQVSQQLTDQRITLPPQQALRTEEQRAALGKWSGETLRTGPQAKAYADQFIAPHVKAMAQGRSYAELGEDVAAAHKQYGKDSPEAAEMVELRTGVMNGELLRGTLLTASAFWTLGTAALGAGAALVLPGVAFLVSKPER